MTTNEKLEVFRKTYCLGEFQITDTFKGKVDDQKLEHIINKYRVFRDKHGFNGNFHFLFSLDTELASILLERVGL